MGSASGAPTTTPIGYSGDDHIGNYGAKDIAAKSFLCHGCWTTHKPYVDESDEDEIERDTNPERHPNRLRWRWPGSLKQTLDTAARRERAIHAESGDGLTIGNERAAHRPRRAVAAPKPQQRPAARRHPGATPASQHTLVRTTTPASRHVPPAPNPPRGARRLPFLLLGLHQCSTRRHSPRLSHRLWSTPGSRTTRTGRPTISWRPRQRPSSPLRLPKRRASRSNLRRTRPKARHPLIHQRQVARRRHSPAPHPPLSQPNLHRWFSNARTGASGAATSYK